MDKLREFLVVAVECEGACALDLVAQNIAQGLIPGLYGLDLQRPELVPELKGAARPASTVEKLRLVRRYLDVLAQRELQGRDKAKKAPAKGAWPEDSLAGGRPVLLVWNGGFGREI